jgi:hypothetical protein
LFALNLPGVVGFVLGAADVIAPQLRWWHTQERQMFGVVHCTVVALSLCSCVVDWCSTGWFASVTVGLLPLDLGL